MYLVDIFASYLFALKYVSILVALIISISSLDDLLIDIVYWCRRFIRWITIYRQHPKMQYQALFSKLEKPLAIMVPAWHETGVIGKMAELAAITLDYENYHIFVGTYPNDPETQLDVDKVCAVFPNVHKVICARPGPTSKADCLNNVLDAILQFELQASLEFSGFILHDSEDVVSPLELRLFNYLLPGNDLIQIPVYPFERSWSNFTCMHYLDEFAEMHGKDVVVREALAGQVPSAGVGTCFSRKAVLALLADGDGIAFDGQSLTEDYDIGFRLKAKGLKEIFVRFPVILDDSKHAKDMLLNGQSIRDSNVICVREYFPDTLATAIRQKSRWITGIVFQGYKTHGWSKSSVLNYFLWRDRKGIITNFISFIASMILIQLVIVWLYQELWPGAYHFLSIFESSEWLMGLMWINFFLMGNRMIQRIFFVSSYYGLAQGLLSIPRLFWGNYINFMANWKAMSQVIAHGDPHRIAWDKTTHDFPTIGLENKERKRLGQILIDQGVVTKDQLESVLTHHVHGIRIGSALVHQGILSSVELADALAIQAGVPMEAIDPYAIPAEMIEAISPSIALHYAILPIRREGATLIVASESALDPISLAAISRKLKCGIRYFIAPKGQVTVGLRRWYEHLDADDPRAILDEAIASGKVQPSHAEEIWNFYVARQVILAEVLVSLGHINEAALRALLLQHSVTDLNLGDFLVDKNIVSRETLEKALKVQSQLQPEMRQLIESEVAIQSSSA
ncbi:phage adsorption protein NrfB [Polynucleobacter sp. 71A-WALBACH]|uniref:glycosyl transferase family protein n=1 Tax=Polynucleobacter sp. 71A-WALBACH TaxID=2689097 RepID=UPI001C0BFBA8|nr:glycosyl transferase family protein [Polynucleobacter sp. 71A-WALBACH]MBU3593673.1 phage adsorption protein NrfB [Polynucleobacter sp. 71A-WALBACH]